MTTTLAKGKQRIRISAVEGAALLARDFGQGDGFRLPHRTTTSTPEQHATELVDQYRASGWS